MDVNAVTTLIGTIGFPCAMCFLLLYIQLKEQQSHKEEMTEMRNAIEKITEAVNNNNNLVQHLIQKIGGV